LFFFFIFLGEALFFSSPKKIKKKNKIKRKKIQGLKKNKGKKKEKNSQGLIKNKRRKKKRRKKPQKRTFLRHMQISVSPLVPIPN